MARMFVHVILDIRNVRLALFYLLPLALALSLLPSSIANAVEQSVSDRTVQIKAAVVFQITKFITLPSHTDTARPLRFCAIGNEEIIDSVIELTQKGKGKPVHAKQIPLNKECAELKSLCDVVFIDRTNSQDKSCGPKDVPDLPFICATDRPRWDGCMAQVFEESNRARVAIDLPVARRLKVKVSSELLSLAIVHSNKQK